MFKKINLQLFAEDPKDKPNDDDPNNNPDDLDDPDSEGGDNDDDEGGKQVTMTQAQLDSLLKRSFAKGARRAKAGAKPTGDNSGEGGKDQDGDVEARIQKANEVMLAGTIKSVAADLGLTSKGAKAAVKLGDFSDCFNEQGEIDEDAVKDNLADFLKEYPEFAVKKDGNKGKGGFKFGADNKHDQDADDEALLSAFGVKKKG